MKWIILIVLELSVLIFFNTKYVSAACQGNSECCGSVYSCTNCQSNDECTNGNDCSSASDCPGGECTDLPWCIWVGCSGTCSANSCPGSTTRVVNTCCNNSYSCTSPLCGQQVLDGCGSPHICPNTDNNCSNAGNFCDYSGYNNSCGSWCQGTVVTDCSNESNICRGVSYTDPNNCGTCTGTKDPNCSPDNANVCAGESFGASNGCGSCSGIKCNAPTGLTLVGPVGDALVDSPVVLNWNSPNWNPTCVSANYVGTYDVCISKTLANVTNGNCTHGSATGITSTSYAFTPTEVGTHYWSVRARSSCGATTAYVTTSVSGLPPTFNSAATLEGYVFDSSDLTSCPATPANTGIGNAVVLEAPQGLADTTDANGFYRFNDLNSKQLHSLSFGIAGYMDTSPEFNCFTNYNAISIGVSETTKIASFGFVKIYGGWWRAIGGISYAKNGMTSLIPKTMPAAEKYMFLSDTNGNIGMPMVDLGSINVGTSPNVAINSSMLMTSGTRYRGDRQDFEYFLNKLSNYDKTTVGAPALGFNNFAGYNEGAFDYQILRVSGNVNNYKASVLPGQKLLILVDGSVTITENLSVPKVAGNPSFLGIIASGTINFASNVTHAQGWFLADTISIAADNSNQFIGEGSFVALDGFSFNRDRGVLNNTTPAEEFVSRADLIINAPEPLRFSLGEVKLE